MNYRQPVSTVNSFKLKVGSSSGQSAGQTINDMGRKREPDTESRRLIWRPSLAALFWTMSTGNYLNKLLGVLSDYEPMYRWLKLKEKVEELKLKKKKKVQTGVLCWLVATQLPGRMCLCGRFIWCLGWTEKNKQLFTVRGQSIGFITAMTQQWVYVGLRDSTGPTAGCIVT